MESNLKAFSFDNLLLDKIDSNKLAYIQGSTACYTGVSDLFKGIKRAHMNESRILYKNLLECDTIVDAKKVYDKFFDAMVKINIFYHKNYNATINYKEKDHIRYFDKYQNAIRDLLADVDSKDITQRLGERTVVEYKIDKKLPNIKNILFNIFKMVGGNFYELNKEETTKILTIISNNYTDILDRLKEEICGSDDITKIADLFIDGEKTILMSKDVLNDQFTYLENYGIDFKSLFTEANNVSDEFTSILKLIQRYKSSRSIKLDNALQISKIEKLVISLINEVMSFHYLVFTSKANAIMGRARQAQAILAEFVDAFTESVEVKEAAIEELKSKDIDKGLLSREELNNSIVELKHDELLADCCMKEAMILTEGVNVEERIQTLHEGVFSKTIEFIKKIREFVVNLFNKVMAWFDKFIKNNQDYINKYKDIIAKPTAGFTTVSFEDYDKGLERIRTSPTIDLGDITKVNASTDIDSAIFDLRKKINPEFTDANGDWKEACNGYFVGGANSKKDKTPNDIDVQALANTVLNIPNDINNIKKDMTTMQQAFKSIETALNSASTRASQIEAQNNQQGEPTGESALLYLNEDVFNELDMDTTNAGAPGSAAQSQSKIANSGNNVANDINSNGTSTSKDFAAMQKFANKLASTISTYYQCKYQMAERIMSDYMKIIKVHVSAYVNANNNNNNQNNNK